MNGLGWLTIVLVVVGGSAAPGQHGRINGADLWWEVRGAGPGLPLMVLNGGPGVAHDYMLVSDVWDNLARRRRVVFYDQRGTGRSAVLAPRQTCTLADQIADLDALRARLGIERMDVLGHSWAAISRWPMPRGTPNGSRT